MNATAPATLEKAIVGIRVFIDTNIIIYLTDMVTPYDKVSKKLFELVENGTVRAFISIVSIAEVMQGPLRRGLTESAQKVKEYLVNFSFFHL